MGTRRARLTARIAAVAIGALMLATTVPVAVPVAAAGAAPYAVKEARLYAPVQSADAAFGWDVDISGNTLVVGAPWYGDHSGRAYVYVRSGGAWVHQATLQAPSPATGDYFGHAVAIDGDIIIVGAPWDDGAHGETGAAYAFRRTGTAWSAGTLLPTELEQTGDMQGLSVDFDGHWAVIGCPERGGQQGAVRPIEWTGSSWDSHGGVTLTGGAAAGDRLGAQVAVAGETILASAPYDSYDPYTMAGSVIAYTWTGSAWAYDEKMFCPEPFDGSVFGGSIGLDPSGTRAVIGSPWWDATPGDGTFAGRAYAFSSVMNDWDVRQTIPNPEPDSPDGEHFGWDVALEDGVAVIGGFWDDAHLGAAYVFLGRSGTFLQQQKITVADETPMTLYFGRSVAIDAGTIAVGADGASSPTVSECGAAFVYNADATITGICRDAMTGLPVAGVEVQLHYPDMHGDPSPASDFVVSGADGRYRLQAPSGQYWMNWLPGPLYQAGWYDDVELWPAASPLTVWAGTTYTNDIALYPVGAVFRFYNAQAGTHFFTNSPAERKMVVTTWPTVFTYEGIAYRTDPATDTSPLFRFYNVVSRSHFYTADASERDDVIKRLGYLYVYDGPTFAVSPVPLGDKIPVYRFYNLRNGSHFYTADVTERDRVIATLGYLYQYEGPVFWIGEPGPY